MAKAGRRTKNERAYLAKVAEMGCIVCSDMRIPDSPAECHHPTGAGWGRRSSHFECIPLCPPHHRTGGYGIALHAGTKEWEKLYGTQAELVKRVQKELDVDRYR